MGVNNMISERSLWLLAIIDSVSFVDGNTRLQKYELLSTKIILQNEKSYDDWHANDFGGFSKQVMMDVDYFTKNGVIHKDVITKDSGQDHFRYSLTKKGKEMIKELVNSKKEVFEKIKILTGFYFPRQLDDLLTDTYTLYPEYTKNSKIKHIIRKTLSKRVSNPNLQYEIPFTTKKPDFSIISSTEKINDFPFNDQDIRLKISKMIGLSEIPKIDSSATKKLSGILSKRFKDKELDAIELVRSVRGHI